MKNASLEKIKGHDPTLLGESMATSFEARYAHFKDNLLDAVAGLRPKLKKDGAKRPGEGFCCVSQSAAAGTRLLPGKFMAVEQAAATKKGPREARVSRAA